VSEVAELDPTAETVRIMVVDDEPDVEMLVSQRFRKEIRKGHMEFVFAHDGQEALDMLAEDSGIMMVLSDINMPRMDGLTLLNHLGEDHGDLKTVVVSAYGDMENIRTAMNRGAFDFVTKPIEFADLETTIRKTLSHLSDYRNLQQAKAAAEMIKATLSRYFSPSVVEAVSGSSDVMGPGGERRNATYMFTDLAGFTNLVETTDPEITVELLNAYIEGIAKIVFAHGGTVMKIIGDAVQAIFGAPVEQADHAARSVDCAIEIDAFAVKFQAEWIAKGVPLGVTRIGVNTGDAIIGNFGGDSFFDYTAYGDAVNIAARLEAANKILGTRICVSQSCVDAAGDAIDTRPSGSLELAGKTGALPCHEPLTSERAANPAMDSYRAAYGLLEREEDGAREAFAALMADLPDDPLVMLHLQRTLGGATDTVLYASTK